MFQVIARTPHNTLVCHPLRDCEHVYPITYSECNIMEAVLSLSLFLDKLFTPLVCAYALLPFYFPTTSLL